MVNPPGSKYPIRHTILSVTYGSYFEIQNGSLTKLPTTKTMALMESKTSQTLGVIMNLNRHRNFCKPFATLNGCQFSALKGAKCSWCGICKVRKLYFYFTLCFAQD